MGAVQTMGTQGANPPSFESVWAVLDRVGDRLDRVGDRLDRVGERLDWVGEKQAETARQMEETDRKISRLGNRIGELIEHFAASNLLEKFEELGYEFTDISRNIIIKNKRKEHLAEIDILLEDGEYVMVIEVKSLFKKTDVEEHQERMQIVRERADKRADKRKYLAAVAGATVDSTAREYALASGMYVIEQTGDAIRIKAPTTLTYW